MDRDSIQFRNLAALSGPHLATNGIVDHANDDLPAHAQRDGNAKMRNAVKIIHRSIQRIDNPLMIAGLISHDPFFAVAGVIGAAVCSGAFRRSRFALADAVEAAVPVAASGSVLFEAGMS